MKAFTLRIERSKWLRGKTSPMMTDDGCGCVIGHYLIAKGVPRNLLEGQYGFVSDLVPFAKKFPELGEFDFTFDERNPDFNTSGTCDDLVGVNDSDPHNANQSVKPPVYNDKQRESRLIRLMKAIGCRLEFA